MFVSDISDWILTECGGITNLITVFGILEIIREGAGQSEVQQSYWMILKGTLPSALCPLLPRYWWEANNAYNEIWCVFVSMLQECSLHLIRLILYDPLKQATPVTSANEAF